MLIDILPGHGPGRWKRCLVDEFGDRPRWGAMVWCPDCGRPLWARDHHIADDGQIAPSLGHPVEYPPCGWHVSPRLIGWAPVPPAPPPRQYETCAKCGARSREIGGWGTWGGPGIICAACIALPAAPEEPR